MYELFELIPILAGLVIGTVCWRIPAGFGRIALLIILSIVCGTAATVLSGEYRNSWGFLALDIPLTFGVALAVLVGLPLLAGVSGYRHR